MTQIDFYITRIASHDDYLQFACRLTEKAYRNKHRVFLYTNDAASSQTIDDLLWTFRPGSFLPHATQSEPEGNDGSSKEDASEAKLDIVIDHSGNPGDHNDVLINLTQKTAPFFSRFDRVAEIVTSDEDARARSRERFKFYRDRGYPIKTHEL